MVTATLRKAAATAPPIDVTSTPVETDSLEAQLGLGGEQTQATQQDPQPAAQQAGAVDIYRPNRYAGISDGALIGDFDESDLRHPTLNIVNGSGKLSQSYPQGTLVFADEVLMDPPNLLRPDPDIHFRFVPIAIQKTFRENLSDEEVKGGQRARVVNSIGEVESHGGTTQWLGDTKPSWSPSARNLLLIELPKGREHPNFVIELDDKRYAVGVYYSSSSAYRKFAQVIFNASLTSLLEPVLGEDGNPRKTAKGFIEKRPFMAKQFWRCRIVKSAPSQNGFSSFQPDLRIDKESTSPQVREFCRGIKEAEEQFAPAAE